MSYYYLFPYSFLFLSFHINYLSTSSSISKVFLPLVIICVLYKSYLNILALISRLKTDRAALFAKMFYSPFLSALSSDWVSCLFFPIGNCKYIVLFFRSLDRLFYLKWWLLDWLFDFLVLNTLVEDLIGIWNWLFS